jgi:hypothetical protein
MNVDQAAYYKTIEEGINLTSSLAFSPDGYFLAAGYANGAIHLWGMKGALESPAGQISQERCGSFNLISTATPTDTASHVHTSTFMTYRTRTFTPTALVLTRILYLTEPLMQGEDVYQLQQRLLELGYTEVGTPDGIFGKLTDAAIRRFQEMNGLEVDGYVGAKTWQVLFSQDAK